MGVSDTEATSRELREQVRERYASAARAVAAGGDGCCGSGPVVDVQFGRDLYAGVERDELPAAALAASLGCGNPIAVAELAPGETVLDLGSGVGIDVILSARRVGPTGKAYGLDMTDEMLDLARRNAVDAGVDNVEFLRGDIESVPLPDVSVDVVISNCVINLSVDKPAVFAEMFRSAAAGRPRRGERRGRRGPAEPRGARRRAATSQGASRARCRCPSTRRVCARLGSSTCR